MSSETRSTFRARSKIISAIRRHLEDQGFLEVSDFEGGFVGGSQGVCERGGGAGGHRGRIAGKSWCVAAWNSVCVETLCTGAQHECVHVVFGARAYVCCGVRTREKVCTHVGRAREFLARHT